MDRPDCKKCHTTLSGEVDGEDITVCPGCGKRWRLTADHSAIYNYSLDVQSGKHAARTKFS